jgi:hypothetical protein
VHFSFYYQPFITLIVKKSCHIKKLIIPKENILLVPKGHFHFSKFANFRPPPCLAPEKPDHEILFEMLVHSCSFRIWAKNFGTIGFFEILYFEVDHFWQNLVGKPILNYKYLNGALTHMKTTSMFRKLLLKALKRNKNCFFKLYRLWVECGRVCNWDFFVSIESFLQ